MRRPPALLVNAPARLAAALGPLRDTLLDAGPAERANPGTTTYPTLIAHLIEAGWPAPALTLVLGEDYATLNDYWRNHVNDPLPAGTTIPPFPTDVLDDMRETRTGPTLDPAVADFVRRIDAAIINQPARYTEFGGNPEDFTYLRDTYTRDGLLAIGAAALRAEKARGVPLRAMERILDRKQKILTARMTYKVDAPNGWVVKAGRAPIERRRTYAYRVDRDTNRAKEGGRKGAIIIPGRPFNLAEVPGWPEGLPTDA